MKRMKMVKYLFNNVIKIKIILYFKLKSCSFLKLSWNFSCSKQWEYIYIFKKKNFLMPVGVLEHLDLGTKPTIYGEPLMIVAL
jgi:hypothetical protein